MANYIIWDNKNSADYGLTIEAYPNLYFPQQKYESETIPGRNGTIFYYQDAWENYSQGYEVYAAKKKGLTLQETWKKIAEWLYVSNTDTTTIDDYINLTLNGYHQFRDSYTEEIIRLASFASSAEIENTVNKIGRTEIEFNFRPEKFAFNAFIETPLGTASAGTLSVDYVLEEQQGAAKPMFRLSQIQDGDVLTVYNTDKVKSFSVTFSGDYSGDVYIDCESQNVFSDELSNLNSYIASESTFPELWEGINTITYTTTGTADVYITPRSWTL